MTAVRREPRELELAVPMGHRVHLPGRGTTFVREAGPDDAPTVVLLHGLMATGGLNWFQCFEPLAEHHHVLAPDLRGHGRGVHSRRRLTMEDCADDVAAMLDLLGERDAVVVGHAFGAAVAEVLWRRHRRHVGALALIGHGAEYELLGSERLVVSMLPDLGVAVTRSLGVLGLVPNAIAERIVVSPAQTTRAETLRKWARREMQRNSTRAVLEGAWALARFRSAAWIADIEVPTTVVVTERDTVVRPRAQRELAGRIPDAREVAYDGDSRAFLEPAFGSMLAEVCDDLVARMAADAGQPQR